MANYMWFYFCYICLKELNRFLWLESNMSGRPLRKMKFILNEVKHGCRLGIISVEQKTLPEIPTPMCMLYTRAGTVPNLTKDVLDRIENLPKIVHMPLPLLIDSHKAVKEFGKGLKAFTAMGDYLLYCSVQDPAVECPTGYNSKAGISLWGRAGRVTVNAELFGDVIEAFQPDFCQVLCDSDTVFDSSKKRLKKSGNSSTGYLEKFTELRNESETLNKTGVLGTLSGGFDLDERVRSAEDMCTRKVDGVVFEGFHNFGPKTEAFDFTTVKELIENVNKHLDTCPNKLRLWHGIMTPQNVLNAVEAGIDILDSSYPYIVTERGGALIFRYDVNQSQNKQEGVEISLKDKQYADDLTPICTHCTCYTCTQHTRSYICHLLNTSELLAGVLLNIHNFHHYFRFFEALRKNLQNNTYSDFRTLIDSQSSKNST